MTTRWDELTIDARKEIAAVSVDPVEAGRRLLASGYLGGQNGYL